MDEPPITPPTEHAPSAEHAADPPRRRRWLRRIGVALAALVALVVVVPLVWPIPKLEGVVEPERLAGAGSGFVTVDGVRVHYETAGSEMAPVTVILLHGFGASTFSWRDQLPLLGDRARVIAFDRPAFGLTERPLPGQWSGQSPYSPQANVTQLIGLMDELGVEKAVIVAHSAGAVVAVNAAAEYPDRIQALVLEAPAIYEARATPGLAGALLRTPQARRIGPLLVRRIASGGSDDFIRSAYYDEAFATAEVLAGYRLPLKAKDWDKGLWELIAAPRTSSAEDALKRVKAPTMVIAGREDTFVPFENSERVASAIASATIVGFDRTGHLPHEELPEQFANEVYRFLDALPDTGCDS